MDDTWHGFRYARIRTTPNGYRHARVTAYTTQPLANPRGLGGPPFFTYEKYPFEMMPVNGVVARTYTRENDYNISRVAQKGTSYSGIADFRSQDAMATETAGPVYDRTAEHLGSTDVALIRFHRVLLRAAKALDAAAGDAAAAGLPALGGSGDFQAIQLSQAAGRHLLLSARPGP